MNNLYRALITVGNFFQDYLLLIIRLVWGGLLIKAGAGKWSNIDAVAEGFASLDIPLAGLNAYIVATLELAVGICFVFGFATRLATIPIFCIMLVALFTAHFSELREVATDINAILKPTPISFVLVALILFAFGPGRISIDYLIERFFFRKKS